MPNTLSHWPSYSMHAQVIDRLTADHNGISFYKPKLAANCRTCFEMGVKIDVSQVHSKYFDDHLKSMCAGTLDKPIEVLQWDIHYFFFQLLINTLR